MRSSLLFILSFALLVGCRAPGCVDPIAKNFDPVAEKDDGSCTYAYGCTDTAALNFDPTATHLDHSCEYMGSAFIYTSVEDPPDCGEIWVEFEGEEMGNISGGTPNEEAMCHLETGITIYKEPGIYDYVATSSWGCKWYESVEIKSAQCTLERILP